MTYLLTARHYLEDLWDRLLKKSGIKRRWETENQY